MKVRSWVTGEQSCSALRETHTRDRPTAAALPPRRAGLKGPNFTSRERRMSYPQAKKRRKSEGLVLSLTSSKESQRSRPFTPFRQKLSAQALVSSPRLFESSLSFFSAALAKETSKRPTKSVHQIAAHVLRLSETAIFCFGDATRACFFFSAVVLLRPSNRVQPRLQSPAAFEFSPATRN